MIFSLLLGNCFQKNTNYNGGDLLFIDNTPSPDHCQLLCQQNQECKKFSYVDPKKYRGRRLKKGRCYLKRKNTNRRVRNNGVTSGKKFCKNEGGGGGKYVKAYETPEWINFRICVTNNPFETNSLRL